MKGNRVKWLLASGVLLVGAAILAIAWQYRDYVTRENLVGWVEEIAAMGPWAFFSLLAFLPLVGAPLSPFLLIAPVFGITTAIVGSFTALAINMTLAWFVSGKWFRPVFTRLIGRFGYSIPEVSRNRMIGFAALIRITPGMPFPLQNYLLGLARMPFGLYLLVSLPIQWSVSASVILLGESFMRGNLQLALIAVGLAIVVALGLRFLRQRMTARKLVESSLMETGVDEPR